MGKGGRGGRVGKGKSELAERRVAALLCPEARPQHVLVQWHRQQTPIETGTEIHNTQHKQQQQAAAAAAASWRGANDMER